MYNDLLVTSVVAFTFGFIVSRLVLEKEQAPVASASWEESDEEDSLYSADSA